MNKCLFYGVKKSGGAGMLFSFPAPFWDCPPLFSFFPSFFPLVFFQCGVVPLCRERGQVTGFLLSASALQPRLACLHSSAHIWRSQGPPPPPRPPPLVWSANTLTSSAVKESRANSLGLSGSDPDHCLLRESHVRSRTLLFSFCFAPDYISYPPGCSGEGNRFFFILHLETNEWL